MRVPAMLPVPVLLVLSLAQYTESYNHVDTPYYKVVLLLIICQQDYVLCAGYPHQQL